VHLVDASELVEVVDVRASEQRTERRVDVGELDTGLRHLAAVDVGENLRNRSAIQRVDAADLRPLARRFDEPLRLLRQVIRRAAAAILKLEREARARAEARNGGRTERDDRPFANLASEGLVESLRHHGGRMRAAAMLPRLELNEEEAHVRGVRPRQQAEAADGVV